MNYASLHQCVLDLEKHGHLIRVVEEVDPYLEMAEIHRFNHVTISVVFVGHGDILIRG